jgi:COP9 signalosome complex subunit 4
MVCFRSAAVTAAILSPAGPQRSRILATLIRDERTSSLDQHTILTKVFLGQIIRASEIASFEAMLAPHQKAELPPTANEKAMAAADAAAAAAAASNSDGDVEMGDSAPPPAPVLRTQTVLSRAMIEHNVLAASTLYANITFSGLALLLDLTAPGESAVCAILILADARPAAESTVRRMVVQGRLKAEIDQVGPGGGVVTFLAGGRGGAAEAGTAGGLGNVAGDGDEGEAQEDEDDPDAVWTRR